MTRGALACLLLLPLRAHAEPPAPRPSRHFELVAVHGGYRRGHDAEATAVVYGPAATLISAGLDRTIRVWQAADLLAIVPGERSRVSALATEGSRIVAATPAGLAVFDVRARTRGPSLVGHTKAVTAVAFTEDGRRLLSAARDQTLRVWDPVAGQPLQVVSTPAIPLTASLGHAGSTSLLADGTILRWDLRGAPAIEGSGGLHLDLAAASPDGRAFVAAGQGAVWSLGEHGVSASLTGATAPITALAARQRRVVAGDRAGFVTVWDVPGPTPVARWRAHAGEITGVALSLDGATVASTGRDFGVRQWDVAGQRRVATEAEEDGPVRAVVITANDRTIVAASDVVRRWPGGAPVGPAGRALALAHGPGGRLLVGRDDGKLLVGDALLPLHRGGINAVAFDAASRRVITAGEDGHVRILEGTAPKHDVALGAPLRALALLPGRAVVAGDRGTLIDVDLATGKATPRSGASRGPILALATDGTRLASGGDDGVVRIDGEPAGRHDDAVRAIVLCPDQRCVVSGSRDGTVRLFADGREQARIDLGPRRDAPRSLVFDADGRLVCGTQRGQVLVYTLR
jgi:WD40 repeat protein